MSPVTKGMNIRPKPDNTHSLHTNVSFTHLRPFAPLCSDVNDASVADGKGGLFLRHEGRIEYLGNALLALSFLQHHSCGTSVGENMTSDRFDRWTEHGKRSGVAHALVDDNHGDVELLCKLDEVRQVLTKFLLALR